MIWGRFPHDVGMGEGVSTDIRARLRRESGGVFEQAVTLAAELRRLGFSHHAVVFELCHHHGYEKAEATRLVRLAAARDVPCDALSSEGIEAVVEATAAVLIAELAACVEAVAATA
jgi:hypothetical protein